MNDSWLFQLKFWFLLILSIPSALCSFIILIHFYQQRNNLSIHHHLTLLLTAISFLQITTQIPLEIAYYQRGEVIPGTNAFCKWWTWWEFSLNGTSRFIMSWGSIERHFLVFHIYLMATKRKRFIFHLLPTIITSFFPVLFYLEAIILNQCKPSWDYTLDMCGAPCYVINRTNLFTYEIIGTIVFPVLIILIGNLFLIFRVVYQKRQIHAAWRRQRKLTMQLLIIALIYILFWFPLAINGLVYAFSFSYLSQQIQTNYFIFLVYMVPILLPFILLATLPELIKKIFRKQQQQQQRVIQPAF